MWNDIWETYCFIGFLVMLWELFVLDGRRGYMTILAAMFCWPVFVAAKTFRMVKKEMNKND